MLINFEKRFPQFAYLTMKSPGSHTNLDCELQRFTISNADNTTFLSFGFTDEEREFFTRSCQLTGSQVTEISSMQMPNLKQDSVVVELVKDDGHDEDFYLFQNPIGQKVITKAFTANFVPVYLPSLRALEEEHIKKFAGLHNGTKESYSTRGFMSTPFKVGQLKKALRAYGDTDVITISSDYHIEKPGNVFLEKIGSYISKRDFVGLEKPEDRTQVILFGLKIPMKGTGMQYLSKLGLQRFKKVVNQGLEDGQQN